MSLLKIHIYGDPVLRARAEEVSEINEEIRQLVENMFDTMYAEDGVGLAAPQVGVSKRVFIVDVSDVEGEPDEPAVFINPEIVWRSAATGVLEEGCLSIPGVREDVKRPLEIEVKAQNEKGEQIHFKADGLFARAIQHEYDHLNGVLFVDYLGPARKLKIKARLQELERQAKLEGEPA